MSKGRVVAIYHRETRKVLGHIPCEVIVKETGGYRDAFVIASRSKHPTCSLSWVDIKIIYHVVHNVKGTPIKVIANSQRDAYALINSQRPTTSELIAALLSEPNPILEGLKA